jgi:hypothetical protein
METLNGKVALNLKRQSFLGANSDDILHHSNVAIIGLGGGGSHVAQQLAHLGVGRFVLLDPDCIEDTNLNRLVGATAADVQYGREKVLIAKRVIEGVNPRASVTAKPTSWQIQAELLQECDVIFACIDSLIGRNELEAYARRYMIPLIDIGMDVHALDEGYVISGQIALSIPGMPCLRCMGLLSEQGMREEAERYGAAGSHPQVIWPNAILASTAVGYFMQLTTPWNRATSMPFLLEYDGNEQTIQPSSKLPYLGSRCKHFEEIGNLGDPFWSP